MIKGKIESQTFNDGLCKICSAEDSAPPGNMPVLKLTEKYCLRYDERTVGIARHTKFLQNDARVDRVLRMPRRMDVSSQDICVPNDGEAYKILLVQYPKETRPKSMDLTLQRIEVRYEAP